MFASSSSSNQGGPSRPPPPDEPPAPPRVTYRHLLSPSSFNVHNPLRVVALIDSDAFYAACEQVRLGLDPEKPIAVQQWQGLIAINYPARRFGITRMMSVTEAKKKCPDLICVHVMTYKNGDRTPAYHTDAHPSTHKVSLDHYRRESIKVLRVFQSTLPGAEVERASIDEAFFDLSAPVREEILRRWPSLGNVPADAPEGMDSELPPPEPVDWTGKGYVLPVGKHGEGEGEGAEGEVDTWGDVALALGAEMVNRVREEVHRQLGYTTSAGIARNKTLAKLCASSRKPFGQTILRDSAIPSFLHPLPFQSIRFLGGKLGSALATAYDAKTVGDLLSVSKEDMRAQFGEESFWVWELLRGREWAEVKEKTGVRSMMASKNVRPSIKTFTEGQYWLRVLSAELSLRLEEARDLEPAVWPKTLVLHIKQGFEPSRSRQCPFPYTTSLSDEYIARLGEKLLRELVGPGERMGREIINLALGFSGLGRGEEGQRSIEGFFGGASAAGAAGGGARMNGIGIGVGEAEGVGEEGERAAKRRRTGSRSGSAIPLPHEAQDGAKSSGSPTSSSPKKRPKVSYKCPRCGWLLTPARSSASGFTEAAETGTEEEEEEDQASQLEALKVEHEDFHFAQDLQAEEVPQPDPLDPLAPTDNAIRPGIAREGSAEPKRGAGGKKKRRKEKEKEKGREGIAAYFQRR